MYKNFNLREDRTSLGKVYRRWFLPFQSPVRCPLTLPDAPWAHTWQTDCHFPVPFCHGRSTQRLTSPGSSGGLSLGVWLTNGPQRCNHFNLLSSQLQPPPQLLPWDPRPGVWEPLPHRDFWAPPEMQYCPKDIGAEVYYSFTANNNKKKWNPNYLPVTLLSPSHV